MSEPFPFASFGLTIQRTLDALDLFVTDDSGQRARVSLFAVPGKGLGIVVWDPQQQVANLTLRQGPAASLD